MPPNSLGQDVKSAKKNQGGRVRLPGLMLGSFIKKVGELILKPVRATAYAAWRLVFLVNQF